MTLEQQIRERLDNAVKVLFKPPVLIGSDWLKAFPGGKPADFQYIGTAKLVKATGKNLPRIVEKLLKQAKLEELGVVVTLTSMGHLNINKASATPPSEPKPGAGPDAQPTP